MIEITRLPVRRVECAHDLDPATLDGWPYTLPPVAELLRDGLDLAPITVLVGENGVGKSTLVEALAVAYGMAPEGGSTGSRHSSRPTESALAEALALVRGLGAPRGGYFLRAETQHGLYSYLEQSSGADARFHALSHGQATLAMLADDDKVGLRRTGLYVFDEPEAGLSFRSQLAVCDAIEDLAAAGSQVVVATHSPVVAAARGAALIELGPHGLRPVVWDALDEVARLRSFIHDREVHRTQRRDW